MAPRVGKTCERKPDPSVRALSNVDNKSYEGDNQEAAAQQARQTHHRGPDPNEGNKRLPAKRERILSLCR
jgi:hypothetical protein